jgi:hypothetical protein
VGDRGPTPMELSANWGENAGLLGGSSPRLNSGNLADTMLHPPIAALEAACQQVASMLALPAFLATP